MTHTLADLDHARREVMEIEARVADARARISLIERQGRDAADARLVLGQFEKAKRHCVERLGAIRTAIGPSAY